MYKNSLGSLPEKSEHKDILTLASSEGFGVSCECCESCDERLEDVVSKVRLYTHNHDM